MWVVLGVVLLDIIGFGLLLPIFPFYATELGASPTLAMGFVALYMAAAFVSAPVLGRLSDRYGRKKIMVFSLSGAVFGYLLLAVAPNLTVVALSRLLSGLMAGNFSACQAYIVDHTDEGNRAKFMGYFSAALGLGYVIGPALGALLAGDSFAIDGFVSVALAAATLSLLALLAVIFFVRENQRAPQSAAGQPSLWMSLLALRTRIVLCTVIAVALLYNLTGGLYEAIFPLWAAEKGVISGPDGMLPMLLGSGLVYIAVQALLIEPLTRRYAERSLLIYSGLGLAAANLAMVWAGEQQSAVGVTLCMMLTAGFAGIIIPVTQIVVSYLAGEDERGAVLGVMGSVSTLARTLATVGSGVLFGQVFVNAPYLLAVLVALSLVALSMTLPRGSNWSGLR